MIIWVNESQTKFCLDKSVFPIPYLTTEACFYTKLLANADRKKTPPFKDIFDLLAMRKAWGSIPQSAIDMASEQYGETVILNSIKDAIADILSHPEKYKAAARSLNVQREWIELLVEELPREWERAFGYS